MLLKKYRYRKDRGTFLWLNGYKVPIFYCAMIFLGITLGAIFSVWISSKGLNGVFNIITAFVEIRKNQYLAETFFSAITPNIICWLVIFIGGFCAVSAPITTLVPFIRSMGYGVIASALIINYPDQGIKYICTHLLPNFIISAAVLVFCCYDSVKMSGYFWKSMSSAKVRCDSSEIPIFCGKMILYGILLAAGAILEAYSYI